MSASKIIPGGIVRAHLGTLVHATTGRARPADYLTAYVVPAVVVAVSLKQDVELTPALAAGLATVAGLAAAFLFQLAVQLMDRAANWADTGPDVGERTNRHERHMREMSANSSYASIIALLCTAALTAGAVMKSEPGRSILMAVGLFLVVHLALTLAMVLKRVFAMTLDRLDAVRTGTAAIEVHGQTQRPRARIRQRI